MVLFFGAPFQARHSGKKNPLPGEADNGFCNCFIFEKARPLSTSVLGADNDNDTDERVANNADNGVKFFHDVF